LWPNPKKYFLLEIRTLSANSYFLLLLNFHLNGDLFSTFVHLNGDLFSTIAHLNGDLFSTFVHLNGDLFCNIAHFNGGLLCNLSCLSIKNKNTR